MSLRVIELARADLIAECGRQKQALRNFEYNFARLLTRLEFRGADLTAQDMYLECCAQEYALFGRRKLTAQLCVLCPELRGQYSAEDLERALTWCRAATHELDLPISQPDTALAAGKE